MSSSSSHKTSLPFRYAWTSIARWVDSGYTPDGDGGAQDSDGVDLLRCLPFIALHAGCLAVLWVGASWTAVAVAAASYVVRMFAVTAAYHRYFSHRSYKTSRPVQFLLAL